MSEGRRIPITDAKTGKVRLSEAVPEHGRHLDSDAPLDTEAPQGTLIGEGEAQAPADVGSGPAEASAGTPDASDTSGGKDKTKKKAGDVETLEDFIRYAYGLKGRKPSLKPKVEKSIAGAARLDEAARERLLTLAGEDPGLAALRQLLLTLRDLTAYPGLRAALRDFVRSALLANPLIRDTSIESIVRNLDDAPPPSVGLKQLLESPKVRLGDKVAAKIKDADFADLKSSVAYCLAAWVAEIKGMTELEVSALLQTSLWGPAAAEIEDGTARLRAITEITDLANTGIACSGFQQEASEARELATARQLELSEMRSRLTDREEELAAVRRELDQLRESLDAAQAAHVEESARLRSAAEVEVSHLRHDLEQLRTRVLRRLKADVEFLETGLEALRAPEPKVHVMEDRAQRAADALRAEIKNLQEE